MTKNQNKIIKEEKGELKATLDATLDEVCDQALAHYEAISSEAGEWNSLIPKAIEFYRNKDKIIHQTLQRFIEETMIEWYYSPSTSFKERKKIEEFNEYLRTLKKIQQQWLKENLL